MLNAWLNSEVTACCRMSVWVWLPLGKSIIHAEVGSFLRHRLPARRFQYLCVNLRWRRRRLVLNSPRLKCFALDRTRPESRPRDRPLHCWAGVVGAGRGHCCWPLRAARAYASYVRRIVGWSLAPRLPTIREVTTMRFVANPTPEVNKSARHPQVQMR